MKTASRPKIDGRMVMAVSHRLTERDRSILTMLYRHRVFTTDQLAEMFFDNINGCRMRLGELAGVPHPPESYRRIEETAEHRRRIDDQRRRDYPDRYSEA
jgi:hypothetical protein